MFRTASPQPASTRRTPAPAIRVEALEDRWCPAVLTVDDDRVQRPNAGFTTIAAALAAAAPGDEIQVFTGTYREQLTIGKANVRLTAKPANANDVVIAAPADVLPTTVGAVNIGGALLDITATRVTVSGFRIDATTADGDLFAAVRVRNGGSATISRNDVVGPTASSDPQSGIGVLVGTSRLTGTAGQGTARVDRNTVREYRGAGVVVDGAGGTATVTANAITGRGAANAGVAQYGVQVSRGATARVERNTISGNDIDGAVAGGSNPATASAGILFFQAGAGRNVAARNTVFGNDEGIRVDETVGHCGDAVDVVNNDVYGNNGYAGINIRLSSGVEVENNDVHNNTSWNGIALDESNAVVVKNNDIQDNPNADGIYVFLGHNNRIVCNDAERNGYNGILLEDSFNNWLWNNTTRQNAINGIKILGGSGNDVWLGDSVSNVEDGILLESTSGNTVVGNYLGSNGQYGLRLVDADNTLVAFNLITGNSAGSIFIDANSTGTVEICNRTDTAPVREGTTGALGTSAAYTTTSSTADAATADLDLE